MKKTEIARTLKVLVPQIRKAIREADEIDAEVVQQLRAAEGAVQIMREQAQAYRAEAGRMMLEANRRRNVGATRSSNIPLA